MNAPVNGFYIYSRSHYAQANHPKEIMIGRYYPEGGCDAEFAIRWHDIGSQQTPRIEIFNDAWRLFYQMEELRGLSTFDGKKATEQQIIDFLLSAGFTDLTKYDGPKPEQPRITVYLDGGLVQDVTGIPPGYQLHVEDHDDADRSHPAWVEEKQCFVTVYGGCAV